MNHVYSQKWRWVIHHTWIILFSLRLVQDDTGGLEVNKDGHWYKVAPIPGAIIILLGDQISGKLAGYQYI